MTGKQKFLIRKTINDPRTGWFWPMSLFLLSAIILTTTRHLSKGQYVAATFDTATILFISCSAKKMFAVLYTRNKNDLKGMSATEILAEKFK